MNIQELHLKEKAVSAIQFFKKNETNTIALQILKGEKLNEHVTKTPALLICIDGEAMYESEKGEKITLKNGDYVEIEPQVKHWVIGINTTQLLLIK